MTPTCRTLGWLVLTCGLIGCGGPNTTPTTNEVTDTPVMVAVVPSADDKPKLAPTPLPPAPKPNDHPVARPSDAVANALKVPPPLPPALPATGRPKQYASQLDRGEFPLPSVPPKSFSPTIPSATATRPSPPPDRGVPDTAVPTFPPGSTVERPRVKAAPPPNPGATDVPMQAWKRGEGERAALDDPTADLSAGLLIRTPLPLPLPAVELPFLRVSIPDPFEWAGQLKGKIGKDAEHGATPVEVLPGK